MGCGYIFAPPMIRKVAVGTIEFRNPSGRLSSECMKEKFQSGLSHLGAINVSSFRFGAVWLRLVTASRGLGESLTWFAPFAALTTTSVIWHQCSLTVVPPPSCPYDRKNLHPTAACISGISGTTPMNGEHSNAPCRDLLKGIGKHLALVVKPLTSLLMGRIILNAVTGTPIQPLSPQVQFWRVLLFFIVSDLYLSPSLLTSAGKLPFSESF